MYYLTILVIVFLAIFWPVECGRETFTPFDGKAFPMNDVFTGRPRTKAQLWSTLVGGHYFSLKAAVPNSPVIGMMWFKNEMAKDKPPQIRHWCRHEDLLKGFNWNYHDLRYSGHQTIEDLDAQVNTSFINVDYEHVLAQVSIYARLPKHSLILYIVTNNEADKIEPVWNSNNETDLSIDLKSLQAGDYRINFRTEKPKKISYQSFLLLNSSMDKLTETVLNNLYKTHQSNADTWRLKPRNINSINAENVNFLAYQIEFDNKLKVSIELSYNKVASLMPSFDYDEAIDKAWKEFSNKFQRRILLSSTQKCKQEVITFAEKVLSNLIGGISYYNGMAKVHDASDGRIDAYGPMQLLTAIPSRVGFPRGFLWDEGFHQLLIQHWDVDLSKTVVKSWFNMMNRQGWIPREIVIDTESIARQPQGFVVQHSDNANPPTFFFTLESMLAIEQNETGQLTKDDLHQLFPRLKAWYNWYNTTQAGKKPSTYRWRGRQASEEILNPYTLTSGFDDYPRATHPTEDEIHVDLRCWMAMASRVMAKIAKMLNMIEESEHYDKYYVLLANNTLLEHYHWSEEYSMFCDYGLHSDNVTLNSVTEQDGTIHYHRNVLSLPKFKCVHEFGYVALFPMLMKLLEPDNPKLNKILNDLTKPELLWTPYGLRSIATTSYYYERYNPSGPYWRGTIWININFMTLRALHHYRITPGPYSTRADQIYEDLRGNLIKNVHKQFKETGYIWEYYSDHNGYGGGNHPFTGWSALIANIIAERY